MDVEICADSVESALAAAKGGAKRIELCSALSEGGITPSAGLIGMVRQAVDIQFHVIIRPRGGGFVYSESELAVMRRDISAVKALGADGVVLGILNPDATVDRVRTTELVELAGPLRVTFHRAFDVCSNLPAALEDVIACGVDRLLTAGGQCDAIHNVESLAGLQRRAAGRIRIMAGGGIRIGNVREIVTRTGIEEVHTSLSTKLASAANDAGAEASENVTEFASYVVTDRDVRAFQSVLHEIEAQPPARVQYADVKLWKENA